MDLLHARLAGLDRVQSLRGLCLWKISSTLQVGSNDHGIVQRLLLHLPPDDVVEVLDQNLVYDGAPGVCPYDMLLPRPRVLLASTQLRGKLLAITRRAVPDATRLPAREALLQRIESAKSQAELFDALEFGTFLCEMGWHEDGMLILEKVANALYQNPAWSVSEMALDCAIRQLAAAVAAGQVTAADMLAVRVGRLYGDDRLYGLARSSGLLAAAAAGLARWNLLRDRWGQAALYLITALEALPSDGVPADLSAELPRLTCELFLAAGRTAPLVELAPQALSAAHRHWGELHPQTLAAVRMMTDFALLSGLTGMAQDFSDIAERLTDQLYGVNSVARQRQWLDRAHLALRLAVSGEGEEDVPRAPATVRPAALPVPADSCWRIERTLLDCEWVDDNLPALLATQAGRQQAEQLGAQALQRLRDAAGLCETLFGPTTLRLSRVLTSLARQYFSLEMDQLLPMESCASEAEPLLKRAMDVQARLGVPRGHRDSLVTRITLASLLTYSIDHHLLEAEELLRAALADCYGGEHKSHLNLAEHCLRSLTAIYDRHDDHERVAAIQEVLETVQAQRQRLSAQRLPAGGLVAVLPRRPWTQREMATRIAAALREMVPVAPPGGPTVAPPSGSMVAPPSGSMVAPPGPQPAAPGVNGVSNGV